MHHTLEAPCPDKSMQQMRGVNNFPHALGPHAVLIIQAIYLFLAGPDGGEKQPELFGVDCEMCITAEGFELTRVSLINEQLEVILTIVA